MLDGVSLDQLRTFIAAADEGSFSAGGRRLRRAQSVVSQTLANLETQLGVKLFDRSSRSPVLTKQGVALLAEARAVVGGMDAFKARAKGLSDGLEPELSVVVDAVFPLGQLTDAVAGFQTKFPATPPRLYVEPLGPLLPPAILAPPPRHSSRASICSTWDGLLSCPRRTLWRRSKDRFQRVSLRNIDSSSSRTVRSCRTERISAFYPRTPGGSPTSARSTPSCAQVWAGAACRWASSKPTWQTDRW